MMNVSCNSPYHHGDCHHSNISYPYTMNHPYGSCNHVHNTPCQLPKDYRAGGFMLDRNAFMLINSMPFIYAGCNIKYGTKMDVGENIFTRVTQRKDASCVNLNAVFNMCSSNNKNKVLNHFLERIIANKFDDLNNVLPIIKPNIKFTLYFTIRDDNNMIVYEGSDKVYSTEIYYHSTNIIDYFVMSTRNLMITNIPQLEYQGLYKLTLERVDAHVASIDTFEHIEDNLNPYYQFAKNNTTITIQNELIEQTECDDTLLIASSDINHTIHFQANLTTRLRVSFKAFLSDLITTNNTFNVWEALHMTNKYPPSLDDVLLMREDVDQMRGDVDDLIIKHDDDIEQIRIEHENDINDLRTEQADGLDQIRSDIADDIEQVKTDINDDLTQVKTDITDINNDLTQTKAEIQTTIDGITNDMNDAITNINSDIDDIETRVTLLELQPESISQYTQDMSYTNGQVMWLTQGKLFQATHDFVSDKTDGNTIEQSMIVDISDGNIVPIGSNPSVTYEQTYPDTVWNIKHDMDKHPLVFTFNEDGNEIYGRVQYTDDTELTITFTEPLSGEAYLI